MNDIIFSASIFASFLAGMVALFAPCCITVLLPAYLGSIFKQKRNILKMTFVFFLGVSAVIVPIGLGIASLAQFFRNFHKEMYIVGGLFMLTLAIMTILGKGFSILPKKFQPRNQALRSSQSVFVLGILSGAATSCCAPVLAGALTLSALAGSFWKALIVILAYVFGLIFPLFLSAYFWDKFKIEQSRLIKGKIFEYNFAGKKRYIHSTNLIAALVFLIMGAILLILAFSGNAFWSPSSQAALGEYLQRLSIDVFNYLKIVPDFIWAVILGIILTAFIAAAFRKK